jgi:hypothetical protein
LLPRQIYPSKNDNFTLSISPLLVTSSNSSI